MSQSAPQDIKARIRHWCDEAGFDACGFAAAAEVTGSSDALRDFLADGHYGSMDWMLERSEQRVAVNALWLDARSVIVCLMNYGPDSDPMVLRAAPDVGAISVYARNKDYHDVVKKRLKQVARRIHGELDAEVKVFVDTAPVMEKPLAQQAGLGWIGKHTNIVSREFGCWTFIGVIATTLDVEPDAPHADRCGRCAKCVEACPTEAIVAAGRVDARRCISYLTIENKGPIPREFRAAIGNRIYGCDDCLAVCPWNRFAQLAQEAKLQAREELTAPQLSQLLELDDAAFRALFTGSPIKRIGRDRFVRNAVIAAGNSGDAMFVPRLMALLKDESALVRGAVIWALYQVGSAQDIECIQAYIEETELDESVRQEWLECEAEARG